MGWSTNEKALEKKKKQADKKAEDNRKKNQKIQSEKWKDQVTNKKIQEQRQKQSKREQELRKKQELRQLAKKEQQQMAKISKKQEKFKEPKLTQAEINKKLQEKQQDQQDQLKRKNIHRAEYDIENNNKEMGQYEIGKNVDQALLILDTQVDRHPEKRYKAAFQAYCDKRQTDLKFQYPKFKRSQRMQVMRKQFEKSPDNPYNKKIAAYNETKGKKKQSIKQHSQDEEQKNQQKQGKVEI